MKELDINKAKWIENEVASWEQDEVESSGVRIVHCVPNIYESYCKIFHPFEITPDEKETLKPKSYREIKGDFSLRKTEDGDLEMLITGEDGSRINLFEKSKSLREEYESKQWNDISWKEVAAKYGLLFHKEISPDSFVKKFEKIGWPENLSFPEEGYLPRKQFLQLIEILRSFTSSNVKVYQTAPHIIWRDDKPIELIECSLNEVLDYFSDDFIGYLYSEKDKWMVYTDVDLTFTLVGGPNALVETINNSELESAQCEWMDRVDNDSDSVNN